MIARKGSCHKRPERRLLLHAMHWDCLPIKRDETDVRVKRGVSSEPGAVEAARRPGPAGFDVGRTVQKHVVIRAAGRGWEPKWCYRATDAAIAITQACRSLPQIRHSLSPFYVARATIPTTGAHHSASDEDRTWRARAQGGRRGQRRTGADSSGREDGGIGACIVSRPAAMAVPRRPQAWRTRDPARIA